MKKINNPFLKRALYLLAALVLVLVVTNPATLFFLPESARESLYDVWSGLFGDVDAITRVVHINWIAIFKVVVIVLFMALVTNLVRLVMGKVHPKSGKAQSICSMINSYVVYAAALVGLVWALSAIGINLSTIFASLGIVALIIGFAAESLIADIITGIFLVFEDEFNVGDIIEYNGFRGEVVSISVRVTSIKDTGGNIKVVNNSDIRDVLNRSKSVSRSVCDIPVSYSADLVAMEDLIKATMETMPNLYPDVFRTVPEYLGVQELAESSVNLRVCAEVEEKDIFKAARLMNREVKLAFDRNGVEIPFNQLVVHKAED